VFDRRSLEKFDRAWRRALLWEDDEGHWLEFAARYKKLRKTLFDLDTPEHLIPKFRGSYHSPIRTIITDFNI